MTVKSVESQFLQAAPLLPVVVIKTPESPLSAPTPVDPEQHYLQLKQEEFQMLFRIEDAERRANDASHNLNALEQRLLNKKEAAKDLPDLPGTRSYHQQLKTEMATLEERIADLKPRRDGMIRLVACSKRTLKEWREVNGEQYEACKEISRALDRARL